MGLLAVSTLICDVIMQYFIDNRDKYVTAKYKRVVDEFPESLYVPQARQELVRLG